jgi:uncharacterized protein
MSVNFGRVKDRAYASRSDVLVFTSNPAESANGLEIIGTPIVTLAHSSGFLYADIWVRLCEVDTRGKSHSITEEFRVLRPDGAMACKPVSLALRDCAHRFRKGMRIRLIVAGGSWPTHRNLGTAEDTLE